MSSEQLPRPTRFKRLRPFETWVREQVAACRPRAEIAAVLQISPNHLSDFLAYYNIRYDKSALAAKRATHLNFIRSNPDLEGRRREGHRTKMWTPEMRAAQAAKTRSAWANPETRAKMVGAMNISFLDSIVIGKQQELARQAREAKARKRAERLEKERAEAELQARLATMTPFERQLELARLGRLKLVERQPMKVTLGGIPVYR